MVQLLEVIRPLDATLADRISATLANFGVGVVANQIETTGEAGALARMSTLIHDHLATPAPLLATVRRMSTLAGGLRAGAGTLATGDDAGAFRKLAQRILQLDLAQLRGAERTAQHATQPLWIQRDAVVADG